MNIYGLDESLEAMRVPKDSEGDSAPGTLGPKDAKLAGGLIKAGDDEAKAIRGIQVYMRLYLQAGWMIQFETYRHGVECLSTSSSMHGELKHLSGPALAEKKQRDLPEKVYKRILYTNYQTLRRIYRRRRKHRHPDWGIFCDFIETLPYFDKLIIPL